MSEVPFHRWCQTLFNVILILNDIKRDFNSGEFAVSWLRASVNGMRARDSRRGGRGALN